MTGTWVAGIDVSNWQGVVDWPTVSRAGIDFAVCKATQGRGYVDPSYPRNVEGARAAGLAVGAYHFANLGPAGVEARHFLDIASGDHRPDLYVLDFETIGAGLNHTEWARHFLQVVEASTGTTPWLYTGRYLPLDHRLLAHWPLWLASYTADPVIDPDPDRIPLPTLPDHRTHWDAWQYTAKGRVPGIAGDVDRNVATPELLEAAMGPTLDQITAAVRDVVRQELDRDHAEQRAIIEGELTGLLDDLGDIESQVEGRADGRPQLAEKVTKILRLVEALPTTAREP